MKSSTIRVKRPADPFAAEIAARIASKRSASEQKPTEAHVVGVGALRALAEAIRANPVAVLIMGAR